ncbi:MAG TPA: hypothetical protein VF039_06990 [Longimicrobiales bacterium]
MSRPISAARLVAAGIVMLLAGIQIGTWLADLVDDRVASRLSLLIGLAILTVGVGIIAMPLARR